MFHARSFLFTLGLGAALMYYYDPLLGRSRRARMRDRLDTLLAGARRLESRVARQRPRLH